jgi:cytoskeleton protein RodZ
MAASFGEQLRTAREARNISLREVSEQTRISMRYLEAIETDDYQRLPGGIFNKSFIKSYARYIHFNEDEALEGYTRTAREQGESPDEVASTPYQPRVYTDDSARSPIVTGLLTVVILAVISLGVYAGLHWYLRQRNANAPRDNNAAATIVQTNTQTAALNQPNSNPNAQTAPTTSLSPPTAANTDFNIQIKARGTKVWIRAKPDDGNTTEATLLPNESKEFKPQQALRLNYAKVNAPALEVTINGRAAKVPNDSKGVLAEMLITKENYQQQLQ